MWVLLWTDALLWLLVALGIGYAIYVRRQPHLLAPWQRVARSAAGMSSLVFLVVFIAIALLDSIHLRPHLENVPGETQASYSVEVLSTLDILLTGLRTHTERTYSAPLATRAYAKETMERPDGTVTREFPRLQHGGAHLQDEALRTQDVAQRAANGAAWGVFAWLLVAMYALLRIARKERVAIGAAFRLLWRGDTVFPWRATLVSLLVLCGLSGMMIVLAQGYHVLGTDKVGQDVLYQALKSIRTGVVIGGLTTLVMLPLAILLGIMAGYFKGWVDDVVQYIYTTLNSIPGVLLIAAAVLMMQVYIDKHPEWFPTTAQRADLRLLFLCIILGVTSWTGLARLLRGEALKLRELEYIQAAKAFGVRGGRIITRHVLPNVMHIVLISLVMDFSGLVLAEAVLSYIGVGVDPSMISFGTMINAARLEMAREPMVWWTLTAAFVFMFALVLAANLFADAVRDAFDPRVSIRPRLAVLARTGR
ncbi:MAG TPA: ABC transporter permease [Burkholderiales bacterium]